MGEITHTYGLRSLSLLLYMTRLVGAGESTTRHACDGASAQCVRACEGRGISLGPARMWVCGGCLLCRVESRVGDSSQVKSSQVGDWRVPSGDSRSHNLT